jgi:hypothetical protein
MLLLE